MLLTRLLVRFLRRFCRREPLIQLRRVVLAIPDAGFDMQWWSNTCGTTHCAAGWAALDPWFLAHTAIGNYLAPYSASPTGTTMVLSTSLDPLPGLARVFGLTEAEATRLLVARAGQPVSRRAVVAQIDALLAGRAIGLYAREEPARAHDS